jgi:hypothetical protein
VITNGVAGPYEFMTFKEAGERSTNIASAAARVGLKRNDKIGVLGLNSPEWMLAMQVRRRAEPAQAAAWACMDRFLHFGSCSGSLCQGQTAGAAEHAEPMLLLALHSNPAAACMQRW